MAFLRPDSYRNIRGYAKNYTDAVKSLPNGKGMAAPVAGDDVFAVLMDKGDVARLLLHPNCHKLAAIIGIEDNSGSAQITISLLAVGADGKVLPEHQRTGAQITATDPVLPGEEVWPEKKTVDDLGAFLP